MNTSQTYRTWKKKEAIPPSVVVTKPNPNSLAEKLKRIIAKEEMEASARYPAKKKEVLSQDVYCLSTLFALSAKRKKEEALMKKKEIAFEEKWYRWQINKSMEPFTNDDEDTDNDDTYYDQDEIINDES